jgi:hypothetical protein
MTRNAPAACPVYRAPVVIKLSNSDVTDRVFIGMFC